MWLMQPETPTTTRDFLAVSGHLTKTGSYVIQGTLEGIVLAVPFTATDV